MAFVTFPILISTRFDGIDLIHMFPSSSYTYLRVVRAQTQAAHSVLVSGKS